MKQFQQNGETIVLENNIEKTVKTVLQKNDDKTGKKNDIKNDQDYGQSFKSLIKSIVHPVTRGILTSSDPVDSEKWKEFQKYKNEFLERACNDPKLDAELKSQLQRFGRDFNSGLISKEEFDRLIELNKEQAKKADAAHKAYIDSLEKAAKDANDAILKKIKDDAIEGDDLNKYRIIQLLLLCSPLLPIPIAGVIFNALQPFLSGALDIPNFLGSFFSVDGPFGDFAWLTDKIGLDDLTTMTGDLFGGPLSVVQNLVVNPITSPIMTSVGGALAGSPLTVFALVAAFEVATDYNKREIARLTKSANILPDAKKSFDAAYEKLRAPEVERLKKQAGQYSAAEIALRKNLFVAAKAAEWLQAKHKSHPKSCKTLLENLFGDKAKGLLKPDKSGLVENLIENLYKLINEAGFKSLLQLRQAGEALNDNTVDKVFSLDEKIEELEKLKASYTSKTAKQEGQKAIKITDIFEEDGKKPQKNFVNGDGSLKFDGGFVEVMIDNKAQYFKVTDSDTEKTKTLDDLFQINSIPKKLAELKTEQKQYAEAATKGIDADKIIKGLEDNFYFFEADKLDIKHQEVDLESVSKAVDAHYQQEFNRAKHKLDTPNTTVKDVSAQKLQDKSISNQQQ